MAAPARARRPLSAGNRACARGRVSKLPLKGRCDQPIIHDAMQKISKLLRIDRARRYRSIMGNFGEWLVCHWLSRSGFEVAIVDQIGLDIIAAQPHGRRLGITVKARTRLATNPTESVYIFRTRTECKQFELICAAFGVEPWVAVYIERESEADLYLTSLKNYRRYWRSAIGDWKMTAKARAAYMRDHEVRHIALTFKDKDWGFTRRRGRASGV
ncbi:MAG: hypothetical protein ACREPW_14115 [Candidatus Binataceae bacterium]